MTEREPRQHSSGADRGLAFTPRPPQIPGPFKSIFTPSTLATRAANFEAYWRYMRGRDGAVLLEQRALETKQQELAFFQGHPVRSRRPLRDPERFYRNAVVMRDDLRTLDRPTLLLTFLYKFARHEWVGISAAWDSNPVAAEPTHTMGKIRLYHLFEEFSHMRVFLEMFRTFRLDAVEWASPGKWMSRLYRAFCRVPGALMAPAAFVTELMGLTVYRHLDRVLDDVLADEPEARERVRELLHGIMIDELSHVGQRRNFLGPLGVRAAQRMVGPMYRAFFGELPETRLLFDFDRMTEDGRAFDYNTIPAEIIAHSWVPSYCRA
jgi:hypothetical protein